MKPSPLKKEIGYFSAVAYGIGIIIGAGIYALIGKAAGLAGNSVWISFILAGTVAAFTGLTYGELSSIFPVSSAEYAFVERAFRSKFLAFIIGWLVLLSGIISASAIALGFGGYFRVFVAAPEALTAVALILILTLLNLWGIKEAVRANVAMALIEISGLILIIIFGAKYFGSVNYFEAPQGLRGITSAAALVFFAFLGFESLSKIAEETKNPKCVIPRSLIVALAISTTLFILVSISVISVIPYSQLATSTSPLTDVVMKTQGSQAALIFSVIALFATSNTILITLTATSRIAFGMAMASSLPPIITRVQQKTGTPWVAVLLTGIASLPFVLLGDIELVANVTNLMIFLVFLTVNLALIALSRKRKENTEDYKSPFRIRNVPLTAIFGAATSFIMLFQFNAPVIIISALATAFGILTYAILRK